MKTHISLDLVHARKVCVMV